MMFNLGQDGFQEIRDGHQIKQPGIQLWGQTIQPFTFSTSGCHAMFGVRFFPHTAALFFNERIEEFNDQIIDFEQIGGKETVVLHAKLIEARSLDRRIELVEEFLLFKLSFSERKIAKLKLVDSIMKELAKDDFFEKINTVASRYGVSSRYLQKIFLNYSGLSPNLFSKIGRFQKSLHMVIEKNTPLTTVAYECGYFDQSHFIKDFKFFTGSIPSRFSPESSTDLFAALQN
ncbi:AraC family transcriptional regulator [Mucilaginibacter sp. JC4]|uniref:AraC family transcriptional regulator n=2 Tax=Mucilaginibacter aquariorum TaxID=2967225 RepID=A0ABT1SVL8_9SPHI|nr:helix-turn-helix domain-containing protein [Mucilaginibacter aquariorum]MCQ6956384.1 AraC family transcriptional regulator [Mucilaginibacter aquariorum]